MTYKHFTIKDREKLYGLKQAGFSNKEIAIELGKHVASINREIKRNKPELLESEYFPSHAQKLSKERRQFA